MMNMGQQMAQNINPMNKANMAPPVNYESMVKNMIELNQNKILSATNLVN